MKQLKKIFLASSIIEFADERLLLKNIVRKINDILIDYDIYIRMFICEYADNALASERKQNEFSREIDDSDIFFILAGKNLGDYTLEEYRYAVNIYEHRNDGFPKILAIFKTCDKVEQSITNFSANLSANTERVNYKEVAELKVAFVTAIGTLLPNSISFRIENDKVIIAEKTIKL